VQQQRAGCERGQVDRIDDINSAWAAHVANLIATRSKMSDPATRAQRGVEDRAELALAVQEARQVEPIHAGMLPVKLRRYATFSCVAAWPLPSVIPNL
jgi:hypothetical protein